MDISVFKQFKAPRVQDEFHNRWRTRFLSVITKDRVVDASFKRQIENHNIGVCELHFLSEEINHRSLLLNIDIYNNQGHSSIDKNDKF